MLFTFTVPKRDYANIQRYLKKGFTDMSEIIGRVYETVIDDDIIATATVSDRQPEIIYTVSYGEQVHQKIQKQMWCRFENLAITLAFDMDDSYE